LLMPKLTILDYFDVPQSYSYEYNGWKVDVTYRGGHVRVEARRNGEYWIYYTEWWGDCVCKVVRNPDGSEMVVDQPEDKVEWLLNQIARGGNNG